MDLRMELLEVLHRSLPRSTHDWPRYSRAANMHFIGGKGENINSREQGTGIREQGTGNREQRTENREQREEGPRRPIPIRTPEIPAAMDERDLENSLNTGPS